MSATTPLRGLPATSVRDGVRLLSEPESTYRDGAEADVLELVRAARDVSSLSDELASAAQGWAQTYHLTTARANVLRALEVPADARVLEVGAGCGAITRWLGERCAIVDALEPVLDRAVVARERCRDLPNVEIFGGAVEDIPDVAAYDLVVVVGVLEYVGAGTADHEPYVSFLDALRRRLTPIGALVLAIENRLGVKYLAGAPEDHTDRSFDSLEGYPEGGPARTFTARELRTLFDEAGLPVRRLTGVFPDYKLTRVVLDESLADLDETLLYRIPRFPSPDWATQRPKLADEAQLWRTLVESGRPVEFANSFLALAGPGAEALWPPDQLAVWTSMNRRAPLLVRAQMLRAGEGGVIRRRRLDRTSGARSAEVAVGGGRVVWVTEGDEPFRPGLDLPEALVSATPAERRELLQRWASLLPADDAAPAPVDLMPRNIVLSPDGALLPIDPEWSGSGWHAVDILRRGVLWLAVDLTRATPASAWPGMSTVSEVAQLLGKDVGLDGDWLAPTVDAEAAMQSAISGSSVQVPQRRLHEALERRLVDLPLGDRVARQLMDTAAHRDQVAAHADALERRSADLDLLITTLSDRLGALQRSLGEESAARLRAEKAMAGPAVARAVATGRVLVRRGRTLVRRKHSD